MTAPDNLLYTKSHEWARRDGDLLTVGITDHAQAELGPIALLQFPEIGNQVQIGERIGELESEALLSGLYSPVNGQVVETNEPLSDYPELVNA